MKLNSPTEPFEPDELSVDDFIGGDVQIAQPLKGYRSGVDPVLLAASVPATLGQSVLELGCGSGVASLCLGRRVEGLSLTGVELQARYADLARCNAVRNALEFDVHCADLSNLPAQVKAQRFDHVIANPPYFDRARGVASRNHERETGLGEKVSLEQWVKAASKRLAPKGHAHFVQRADRLPDLMFAIQRYIGMPEVQPLCARIGRSSHLVIVRAKKDGRADFCLHAPIIMHEGAIHDENGKNYNAVIEAVLHEGAALRFGRIG